ncbi:uncharacterized protein LOC117118257 isoform X2 [Anneissia japonica]|uniref:uncharacterized protein LOC117118257 isoform X2 n=1 Tax=Anneissia japonica TaxID=1529436 RepID=UPI00142596D6|nr:uncharacterized protein LOC117118257 isoform X2 [Anneissia japonica]
MDSLPFFEIENEDVSETRCREDQKASLSLVYTPKLCAFEWYLDKTNTIPEDKTEHAKLVILSANQCFFKKEYNEARDHFQKGLALLPNNSSLKRRFIDGIIRCSCCLREYEHAQNLAEKMVSDSNNYDQRSSALFSLLTVFRAKADMAGEIRTLEEWIGIHTLNAHLWKSLGDAYTKKLNQDPPEGRIEREDELENENNKSVPHIEGKDLRSKKEETQLKVICACLLTSRICLETFQGGLSSFAKKKTSKMLTEIEDDLDSLGFNKDVMRDIEEHSKALVFSSKVQVPDEKKDGEQKEPKDTDTESKLEVTGFNFQCHYFTWLFYDDDNIEK